MMSNQDKNDFFGKPIYIYTRAQALEDGELVDVTGMAKKAGFKIPVAVTRAVWTEYIEWTDEDTNKQTIQDQSGRLWDVLWMLYVACKRSKGESSLCYGLHVIPRNGHAKSTMMIKLKSVIGGGDNGEPVITIMLPNED
ncbi:MAG TPA: DUF6573 family protein [Gammaproteobacteria bacterium]|jgi:hypothetical protein|nr:DUF6573 family protein [Gammaproteobacteria bacterium]